MCGDCDILRRRDRLRSLDTVAERLRREVLGVERQRGVRFREGIVQLALLEECSSAPEVLTDRANEFECFGHKVSWAIAQLGDITRG
jgi:hypothetical protein